MKAIYSIIIAIILAAIGQVLWKFGMKKVGIIEDITLENIIKIFSNIYVNMGIVCYAISTIFWLISLSKKDLSYVYPFIAGTYVIVIFLSYFFFKENINMYRIFGSILILFGLYIILRG